MPNNTTNTNEVEEVVADEPQTTAPAQEEIQSEAPEAPQEETPAEPVGQEATPEEAKQEDVAEEAKEEPAQPSRRETLRIQSLLKKYGPPPERQEAPTKEALDYNTLEAEPDVIKQLETDRQNYSDQAYRQGIAQSEVREWKRDLKYDAPVIEKAYPFLNPNDKANFNPAAADAMNQKYLRFVGFNPGDAQRGIPESVQHSEVSYKEFIESEMEFVDELANQKIATSQKNIAKQAASTGIRPDGSSAKRLDLSKDATEMSIGRTLCLNRPKAT